jgi:hypothetical protein
MADLCRTRIQHRRFRLIAGFRFRGSARIKFFGVELELIFSRFDKLKTENAGFLAAEYA